MKSGDKIKEFHIYRPGSRAYVVCNLSVLFCDAVRIAFDYSLEKTRRRIEVYSIRGEILDYDQCPPEAAVDIYTGNRAESFYTGYFYKITDEILMFIRK